MPKARTAGPVGPQTGAHDFDAPGDLPPAAWRYVLASAGRRMVVDRMPLLSAGIAFFAVLSIAPVLVTALSVYGAVNTPEQARAQLSAVGQVLPTPMQAVVADQLTSITAASTQALTLSGAVALLLALSTATTAALSFIDALTTAYAENETRRFTQRLRLAVTFVVCGALLLGAAIVGSSMAARALAQAAPAVRGVGYVVLWSVLTASGITGLAVLYRYAPDRRQPRWRWASWGAVLATVLWVAVSAAFFGYVQSLGTYEATYGSLAGVAISMLWVFLTVLLVVLGAVVNAELERQTSRDSTVGPSRPAGQRGAVVADSVPPYPAEG
jgi:membrane protein